MNGGAKQASLGCYRATFTLQNSHACHTKKPLFHTNSDSVGVEKRLFLYIMGSTSKQNPTKTAKQISKNDFYFLTCFYRLDDICMADTMLPPIGCIVIFIFPSLPTFVFFTADLGQKLFLSAVS